MSTAYDTHSSPGAAPAPPRAVAVAHRGDPYLMRENTLPSLRSALDRGADAVEADVRVTGDGVPMLLHDATLERLWGHERRLASLSADAVCELTAGRLPRLDEALRVTRDSRLMIDLPGTPSRRDVAAVIGTVRDCGAADRVYWTGGASAMLQVRALDGDAEIALTWTTLAPPRPALLSAVGPRWLNYRFGLVSRELVDRAHRDGLLVSAWTPDTRRMMRRLLAVGVDSLTTNRIDVLRELLGPSRRPPQTP
ncbi:MULTISPECIES: glycerophosphodiester phosphodiesterase [Streptomyces]|uniref:glycerophosphodiester phosphodiesterase n=1 Tax=Streptomyces TaxID=1883 RepID=UPI002A7FE404|nr:glycerophosphodiester phosphodiesterase [Streptomyces sp. S399]WPR53542.1 glycerophosphodiester phosphodiesterase [Streptomyces sp. S399]